MVYVGDGRHRSRLRAVLGRYGLQLERVDDDAGIRGSYWGAPEAGLVGTTVYARDDTPLHSVLHETAHVVCMDRARRAALCADAGGDFQEEDAVCYLQILLASEAGLSPPDICADMDAWGYTFRLGSALAWFMGDAEDARSWLLRHDVITLQNTPTWRMRDGTNSKPTAAGGGNESAANAPAAGDASGACTADS